MPFYPRVLTHLPEGIGKVVLAEPCSLILYVEADNDLRDMVRNSQQATELAHREIGRINDFLLPEDVCHVLAILWQSKSGTPVMVDIRVYSSLETYPQDCAPMLWDLTTYSMGFVSHKANGIGCRLTDIIAGREMEHFESFLTLGRDIRACHRDYVTIGGGPLLREGMSVPFLDTASY